MKEKRSGGFTAFILSLIIVIAAVDVVGLFGGIYRSSGEVDLGTLSAGIYISSAQGFASEVTVTINVDEDGMITEAVIDASGETPDIGGAAAQKLEQSILDVQGPEIDSVSGATYTSNAVSDALYDCMIQAAEEKEGE